MLLKVFRMHHGRPGPVLHLLPLDSEVIQTMLVEEVGASVRTGRPYIGRNSIDDLCKVALARGNGCFSFLSIMNIDAGAVPPHDTAIAVAKRYGVGQEPAISAVGGMERPCFDLVWRPRLDAGKPGFGGRLDVVRVQDLRPAAVHDLIGGETSIVQQTCVTVIDRSIG